MKIIAFGHRQRTGKDTAAKFMITHLRSCGFKGKCHSMGIFDPVRDIATGLFRWAGLEDAVYYENHPEAKDRPLSIVNKTPRQIYLELGYSLMQISERTIPELALQGQDCDILLWTGLRRKIEIEYVRKYKGVLIEMKRDVPKLENTLRGHPAYSLDSELDDFHDWDYVIDNNGTLRHLNLQITEVTDQILNGAT